jgi:hypothetical protein
MRKCLALSECMHRQYQRLPVLRRLQEGVKHNVPHDEKGWGLLVFFYTLLAREGKTNGRLSGHLLHAV